MKTIKTLYVTNRKAWREWLEKNHTSEKEVWLIHYKKHTGKPIIPYNDAVEEAICFGWIDSIIKRIDDEKYARKFTPRTKDSEWSELNKKRANEMIALGKMTEVGLQKIEEAKRNGMWSQASIQRKEFELSPEYEKVLKSNKKAWYNFSNLAPSYKKNYIGWVMSAKREKTKDHRFKEILKCLEQNKKLGLK
jgi:uncharacterized protein YdeI (YjbR/CyaY-like superfamily)